MRIDFKKLRACGIEVEYHEKEKCIDLHSKHHDPEAHKLAKELAQRLEFSDMETDELTCTIYRLQMFKALKFASGA